MAKRFDSDIFRRQANRLAAADYGAVGAYFLAICTTGHEPLFGQVAEGVVRLNEVGRVVEACWEGVPEHFPFVTLDAYVVMPNHMHGILWIHEKGRTVGERVSDDANSRSLGLGARARHASPLPMAMGEPGANRIPRGTGSGSLGAIVGAFKAAVTRKLRQMPLEAPFLLASGTAIWQRNYYEHIIRGSEQLARARRYIQENPLRWAEDPEYVLPR